MTLSARLMLLLASAVGANRKLLPLIKKSARDCDAQLQQIRRQHFDFKELEKRRIAAVKRMENGRANENAEKKLSSGSKLIGITRSTNALVTEAAIKRAKRVQNLRIQATATRKCETVGDVQIRMSNRAPAVAATRTNEPKESRKAPIRME